MVINIPVTRVIFRMDRFSAWKRCPLCLNLFPSFFYEGKYPYYLQKLAKSCL